MNREKQIAEGRRRLEMLGVVKNVLNDYDHGVINYSERVNKVFNAILYWVDNKPEVAEVIKAFEEEYGCLVYHAQLTHTCEGEMWSFLYVSKNEEEWEYDREDITNGQAYAYVWWNEVKEIGSIGVKPSQGGVLRTW